MPSNNVGSSQLPCANQSQNASGQKKNKKNANSKHGSKGKKKKDQQPQSKKTPQDKVYINCEHGRSYEISEITEYKVVYKNEKGSLVAAGGLKYENMTDKVKIKWDGPNKPAELSVNGLDKPVKGAGNYDLPIYYKPVARPNPGGNKVTKTLYAILNMMRTGEHPTPYTINDLNFKVTAFDPSQWKLIIKLPKFDPFKIGSKIQDFSKEKLEKGVQKLEDKTGEHYLRSGDHRKIVAAFDDFEKKEHERTDTKFEKGIHKAQAIKEIIRLEQDNHPITLDELKSIGSIINFGLNLYGIIDTIKNSVPKIGWYADFDVKVFDGEFSLEWGYVEKKNWDVAFRQAANIDLTLIEVTIEIGFGWSGFTFKAQIFGFISGSIKLKITGEIFTSDSKPEALLDKNRALSASPSGEISGGLGVRFEAGYFAQIEGKLATGIKVEGKLEISKEDGWNGNISVKWTGINATITYSLGKGGWFGKNKGQTTKSISLIDEKTLWQGSFPKDEDINIEKLSRDPVINVILDVLNSGMSVRVFKTPPWAISLNLLGGDQVENRSISEVIADIIIDQKRYCKLDQKSIEGFANEVRQILDSMGDRFGRKYILKVDFDNFIKGSAFEKMVHELQLPIKNILVSTNQP